MKSYDTLYEQGFFIPQNSNAVLELLRKDNLDYFKKKNKAKRLGQVKGFMKGLVAGGILATVAYFGVSGIDYLAEKLSNPNFIYQHFPNWIYHTSVYISMIAPVIALTDSEGRKAERKFGLENKVE